MNPIIMDFASVIKGVYRIYIDAGNSITRASCIQPDGTRKQIDIPTLAIKSNDKINQKGYLIKDFEGSDYIVGDENQSINTNIKLSKMDIPHKLTILTAIYQLTPAGASVDVYVGMPIQPFFNETHKNEYLKFLFPSKSIKFSINNESKTLNFRNARAFPESIGYVYRKNISHMIAFVDIGYTTIDCAIFVDYAPIKESIFTIIDGANPFKIRVRDILNKELLLNIQMYQMDDILQNGLFGLHHDKAEEIIYNCKIEYLQKILNEMIKHNYEIETLPVVFGGGGSILLTDIVNEFETFSVTDEPLLDNLYGFEEMGELNYGEF